MKKEKLRKEDNKGITLIALVITIIVLLILAAVTIVTLTGENGILTKANEATQRNNQSKAEEEVKLAIGSLQIEEKQKNIDQNEKVSILEQELKSLYSEQRPETTVNTSGTGFLINHRGYEFKIDDNYNVSYKELFNAEEWDKTATPEDCFQWESDVEGEDGYDTIVGYKSKLTSYEIVNIPSRCKKIICNMDTYNDDDVGRAFCTGVKELNLPNTVTEIGYFAFGSTFGTGFTQLEKLVIPSSVTSIGSWALGRCEKLRDIKIPDSITSVSGDAFYGTQWYDNQPDGMIYIGKVAYKYKGTMPSNTTIELKQGTTSISSYAFCNCENLINIVIPDSITTIGGSAFSYCTSLESIQIPKSVVEIEDDTFYCCRNLNSIIIPDNITKVGREAFYSTEWYQNQPDGIVYVGKVAYKYKGTMPSDTTIELKQGTTSISSYAFDNCENLTSIKIPNGVIDIGNGAFVRCTNLKNIEMPENIVRIEASTFYGCTNLENISIPQNVNYIGEAAFANCTSLSNIVIWQNVDEIGYRTFDGWQNTQTINIEANQVPAGWDSNWNYGCNANIVYAYTGE